MFFCVSWSFLAFFSASCYFLVLFSVPYYFIVSFSVPYYSLALFSIPYCFLVLFSVLWFFLVFPSVHKCFLVFTKFTCFLTQPKYLLIISKCLVEKTKLLLCGPVNKKYGHYHDSWSQEEMLVSGEWLTVPRRDFGLGTVVHGPKRILFFMCGPRNVNFGFGAVSHGLKKIFLLCVVQEM